LRRVERALRRDTAPLALTAGVNSGRHPALDGEPAVRGTAQAGAGLRVHGERWSARLQLGALADPLARPRRHATLAGSHVALELPDAVLAFGAVDRWWGPGRFASPVLS